MVYFETGTSAGELHVAGCFDVLHERVCRRRERHARRFAGSRVLVDVEALPQDAGAAARLGHRDVIALGC